MAFDWGIALAERGLVPLPLLRRGIRSLLRTRLDAIAHGDQQQLLEMLRASPVALATETANAQHYEVPAEFFELVLGPRRKYSGCYWPDGVTSLAEAEVRSLEQVAERAQLEDGQRILDLGCGWGSFSLYAAERYPHATVVGVSNSRSQADAINARGLSNLQIITADMNRFDAPGTFDRIVSIEMFEHMRNYETLFRRIADWLEPTGRMFVHVFCHRDRAYPFETEGRDDWMGRHFFTGGLMPSLDLFRTFDADLVIERQWTVPGTHYQRTAAAWRGNLESRRDDVLRVFRSVYGGGAKRWYHRWRLFFLACEELFGYDAGDEWMVGHYRFVPAAARRAADRTLQAVR